MCIYLSKSFLVEKVAQKWLKVWEVGLLFDFDKPGTFLQERKLKFCWRLAESFIKDKSKLKHKSTSTKLRKLFFEPTMNNFKELSFIKYSF
jgi:hypothetical protein